MEDLSIPPKPKERTLSENDSIFEDKLAQVKYSSFNIMKNYFHCFVRLSQLLLVLDLTWLSKAAKLLLNYFSVPLSLKTCDWLDYKHLF